mmetsp:Transcript_54467/g.151088  ORF Transcript_54467/g.151088 Transcript_54467/m.151088 type:complete len:197 (-) Transcript_54467:187-777(-)
MAGMSSPILASDPTDDDNDACKPCSAKTLVLGTGGFIMITGVCALTWNLLHYGLHGSLYANVCLVWYEAVNLNGAIPHIFLLDSGLETVAGIELGPDSPARTVAIFMHAEEGFHRFFASVIGIYVACFAAQYKWLMLCLRLAMVFAGVVQHKCIKDLTFHGKNLAENAPGRFREIIHASILVLPMLIVAVASQTRR